MTIYLLGSYHNIYTGNYAYNEPSLKKLFLKEHSAPYGSFYVDESIKIDFEKEEISIEVNNSGVVDIETYSFITIQSI